MNTKFSLIFATVVLGCLYSVPLYVTLGGANTLVALTAVWLLCRLGEFLTGEKTWLLGLKDYTSELLCLGMFAMAVLVNILLERGITGKLHFYILCRQYLALFIICSYSRVPFVTPKRFAISVLLVLGTFAWTSLPTLIENPMLPRLTQQNEEYALLLLHKGITRYSSYAATAIMFPCLIVGLSTSNGPWGKLFFAVLGLGLAFTVFLSGFMAAALTLVVTVILVSLAMLSPSIGLRHRARFVFGTLTITTLTIGMAVFLSSKSEGFSYAAEKAWRIFSDTSASGLEAGDETGRYDRFRMSAKTFLANPWFGIGPVTGDEIEALQGVRVGGHASLIDQLAEYGILGFGWYLLLLGLLSKRVLRGLNDRRDPVFARAVAITWLAFLATSIYNMTTWVSEIVVVVFGFVVISSFPQCRTDPAARRVGNQPVACHPEPPKGDETLTAIFCGNRGEPCCSRR